jgi:hypothetical protein
MALANLDNNGGFYKYNSFMDVSFKPLKKTRSRRIRTRR